MASSAKPAIWDSMKDQMRNVDRRRLERPEGVRATSFFGEGQSPSAARLLSRDGPQAAKPPRNRPKWTRRFRSVTSYIAANIVEL